MPTVAELLNAWTLPDRNDATYDTKVEFLLWYVDVFLQAAAGHDMFGPNIRRYKTVTEMVPVNGKRKPNVSASSEAFGILMLENCTPKWGHVIPKRIANGNWKVPQYKKDDESTHPYHNTVFSDRNAGQVTGGGWSGRGFEKLNEYQVHILAQRKADKKKKFAMAKFALHLIRDNYKITATEHTNKRKRRGNQGRKAPVNIVFIDEVEEDYR